MDLDLFDVYQQGQIDSAAREAANAQDDANHAVTQIRKLSESVDKLALINKALWEIIKTELGKDDSELYKLVKEIDLKDGRLDGKISSVVKKCHRCGRTVNKKHQQCLYCGSEALDPDVFQSV